MRTFENSRTVTNSEVSGCIRESKIFICEKRFIFQAILLNQKKIVILKENIIYNLHIILSYIFFYIEN